jgi:beta-lactam-binding protein with PASTA domain
MTTCASCGRTVEAGSDFCACGEYVRWEPTGYLPAITPEQAAADAQQRHGHDDRSGGDASASTPVRLASEGAASLTLRLPDDASAPSAAAAVTVGVVPGGSATVVALIRNQSGIVDNYDLEVRGIPRAWWTARPETVYLVPYGSAGVYEEEIQLHLHPPRTPQAQARLWDLEVVAVSRAAQGPAAVTPLVLAILPYEQVEVKPTPDRRSGRRKVRYDVAVRNRANAALDVVLDARDTDGECRTRFAKRTLSIAPGEIVTTTLEVRPPRQRLIGRPLERRIEVSAATGDEAQRLLDEPDAPSGHGKRGLPAVPGLRGPRLSRPDLAIGPGGVQLRGPRVSGPSMGQVHVGSKIPNVDLRALQARAKPAADAPLTPTQVIFRQRSWLPWWLAVVVPLLLALLLLLWLLWPRTTHVPNVTGASSVFAAQQTLEGHNLILDPNVQKVVRASAKPGSVVGQAPNAGKKVDKGSAVVVQVAVGTSSVKVPQLAGKNLSAAEQALRAAQLVVGRTSVTPPDPKAKIASQIPAAGELVREGSPVDVYYGKPGARGGGAAGAGAGAGGGSGGTVAVPAIDPKDVQGYAAKVSEEGLVPQPVQQFSSEPKGTVFGTQPSVGTEVDGGSQVRVLVSAGYPQLVLDDDHDVLRIDGATGKRLGRIAHSGADEKDPTWSADGTRVAFEQDGRIMLADVAKPEQAPVAITADGERYADPSFAPTPQPTVLAVARLNSTGQRNDTDLCLGLVTAEGLRPQCIVDEDTGVGDAKWAPDGKAIYVPAIKHGKAFGIVRYRSDVAFSPRASDWHGGDFVTPTDPVGATGVRDIAISPDGKRIAVISNIDSGEYRLAVTALDDLRLQQPRRFPVQACKVIWRPDGKEVVIVQAGALCRQPTGQLFRIEVDRSPDAVPLSANGDNPAFQPLVGG